MPAAREPRTPATPQRILDVAERLVQTRGFNGFSYADIAAEVRVSKASLHYHFATKAELGRRLVERYTDAFAAALAHVRERFPAAGDRLRGYAQLYSRVLREQRMCLCGMLAAEYATLPAPMQGALRAFFELNERWLAAALAQGADDGSLRLPAPPPVVAELLFGALEGQMLVARTYADPERFAAAAELLVAQLEVRARRRTGSAGTRRAARGRRHR